MSKEIKHSKYQIDLFNFVENGSGNAVVQAVAGSGKSYSIVYALKLIPDNKRVLFNAFNVSIVQELKTKIDQKNVQISTSHSLGFQFIKSHFRGQNINFQVDEYKYSNYFKQNFVDLVGEEIQFKNKTEMAQYKDNIINSLNLCRVYLCESIEDIEKIAEKYNFIFIKNEAKVILKLIYWGCNEIEVIDYTDMICLPNYLDMTPSNMRFDFVFCDECQDLSVAQQKLIQRCTKKSGTRFIFVGDKSQCINQFAGSDETVFEQLTQLPDTITLPLSICYRCPKVIEQLAKRYVPNFEISENAIQGEINHNVKVKDITDGSMVLCRTTAPLVALYMRLLRNGIKCFIKGKDIGMNLIKMVEKTEEPLINKNLKNNGLFVQLYKNLFDNRDKLMSVRGLDVNDALSHSSTMYIYDMIQCLNTLTDDGINTSYELINRIKNVFSEENNNGIMLSTCHKSKGLENENVYVLCPSLLPSSLAFKDWEIEMEKNLEYVTYTRTKDTLNFVCEKDFPPSVAFNDMDSILVNLKVVEAQISRILNPIETEIKEEIKPNDNLISLNQTKKEKKKRTPKEKEIKVQQGSLEEIFNKKIKTFSKLIVGETIESAFDKFNDLGIENDIRPVKIDGNHCMVTCDFRPDRINVVIEDNLIKEIHGFG